MHLLLMMIWLPTLIWGYQEHIVSAPYQVGFVKLINGSGDLLFILITPSNFVLN